MRTLAFLYTARPTAVNLGAAKQRIERKLAELKAAGQDVVSIAKGLISEARLVFDEDYGRNVKMSSNGGKWLVECCASSSKKALKVLTVCNTGSLATSVCGSVQLLYLYLPSVHKQY